MNGGGVSPTPPVSPFAPNPDVYAIPNGQGDTVLGLTAADGQSIVALAPRGVMEEGTVGLVANNIDGLIQCETDDTITSCSDPNVAGKFLTAPLPGTGTTAPVTLEFESCAVESDILDCVIAVKWNGQTVCRIRYNSDEDPAAYAYTNLISKSVYLPTNDNGIVTILGANGLNLIPTFTIVQGDSTYHVALVADTSTYGLGCPIDENPALNVLPWQYIELYSVSELTDRHILCEFESVSVSAEHNEQVWSIKYNGEVILHGILFMKSNQEWEFVLGSHVVGDFYGIDQFKDLIDTGVIVNAICNGIPVRISKSGSLYSCQYGGYNGVGKATYPPISLKAIVTKYDEDSGSVSSLETYFEDLRLSPAPTLEHDEDILPWNRVIFQEI